MENIYCYYYDEKSDEEVMKTLNVDEAILCFRDFCWSNATPETSINILVFKSAEESFPMLCFTSVEKGKWMIDAGIYKRRRFMGPFFKKNIFKTFIDQDEFQSEKIIRSFFNFSVHEFTSMLERA